MDLENTLWSRQVETADEWVGVGRYLVDRLAHYLGQPIAIEYVKPVTEEAFTCSISSAEVASAGLAAQGPLAVRWSGVLGMEPIEGNSWVSATLVLFVLGQRLNVGAHASSVVELVYERRPGALGEWRCEGWRLDEYGEWDGVQPP